MKIELLGGKIRGEKETQGVGREIFGKVGMPDSFRSAPFKPAQKSGGAVRDNLGVRDQNSSPPVYWRRGGLAGMPAKFLFIF
jgi:hypothetical protein